MTQALIKALAVMAVAAVANTAHAQQNRGDIRWEPVQVILPSGEQKQYVHSPNDPNELRLPSVNGWRCSVLGQVIKGAESQYITCTSDGTHWATAGGTCSDQKIGEVQGASVMLTNGDGKGVASISIICSVYPR